MHACVAVCMRIMCVKVPYIDIYTYVDARI
jgi:hypothetical protein